MAVNYVTGNPQIKPTIVENVELGWDHTIEAIDGTFRGSVYWQNNDEVKLLLANVEPGLPTRIYSGNVGSSEMVGFDLSLEGQTARDRLAGKLFASRYQRRLRNLVAVQPGEQLHHRL